ncbi:MAG: hypothetical protein AAB668_00100 [Patescibacteria group bacterium]
MQITQAYRDCFAAFLAAAKLDVVDPRITPEEFPNESFEDLNNGLRIVQPSARWFSRNGDRLSAEQIEKWFASEEARPFARCPGTLAHGLYICANDSLEFRFNEWHTLLAFGSRSVTGGLMPTFCHRTDGRALELFISYDRNEPIDSGFAIIVHQDPARSR